MVIKRLLEHSEDADIDEEISEGQSLQTLTTLGAQATTATEDGKYRCSFYWKRESGIDRITSNVIILDDIEGEIKEGEQTAQSLICNDCQKLFRDGK
jgi:hypothetical protein